MRGVLLYRGTLERVVGIDFPFRALLLGVRQRPVPVRTGGARSLLLGFYAASINRSISSACGELLLAAYDDALPLAGTATLKA